MTGDNLNLTLGQNGGNQQLSADDCGKTPTQSIDDSVQGKTTNADLIRELTRAKVAFQLRTLCAVLGVK